MWYLHVAKMELFDTRNNVASTETAFTANQRALSIWLIFSSQSSVKNLKPSN